MLLDFHQVIARKKATTASSEWVSLEEWNPSGASSQTVSWAGYDHLYDAFEVHAVGVDTSVDGATLTVQSLFAGVADADADYNEHIAEGTSASANYAADANAGSTSFVFAGATGNAAGENYSGVLRARNPRNTDQNKLYTKTGSGINAAGNTVMSFSSGSLANTGISDGVVIAPSSGTFSARIVLVGRANIYATADASGGPWTRVLSYTPSSAATQEVAVSSAAMYMIEFENLIPATDGADLLVKYKTDSVKSANYKRHTMEVVSTSASYAATVSASDSSIKVSDNIGNASNEGVSGVLYIDAPSSTALYKNLFGHCAATTAAGAAGESFVAAHYSGDANAVTALEFSFSSGNISSGTITVYSLSATDSGAYEHVSTTAPSGATQTIDLTDAVDGDEFLVIASAIQKAGAAKSSAIRFGSSGIDAGNNYQYHGAFNLSTSASYAGLAATGNSSGLFSSNVTNDSATDSYSVIGRICLPGSSNYATWQGIGASITGKSELFVGACHNFNLTSTLDQFLIRAGTGATYSGGNVYLFKLKQGETQS